MTKGLFHLRLTRLAMKTVSFTTDNISGAKKNKKYDCLDRNPLRLKVTHILEDV